MRKSNMTLLIKGILLFQFLLVQLLVAQSFNPDTVKAGKFDTGKMWTFDDPPYDYLKETYNFEADEDWFDHVRLSALRIPGCTASFVSEDGLIMTNHHCAAGLKSRIQQEGEDLNATGFYAATLEDERPLERYFAEQLVLIEDVTNEVLEAFNSGNNDEEKTANRDKKIEEIENTYNEETGLSCSVVSLYNGGRYSLYGYKRHTNIKAVFIPETQIGAFGGDYDNFTYPRYNLDCAFLRIYDDNGNPIKSENFFKWNPNGAPLDDVIFTVGNPGSTSRLSTVSQLEYSRDVQYRNIAFLLNSMYNDLEALKYKYPERADEFERMRTRIGNGQKSINGTYEGLIDPYLIARRKAFENGLKAAVNAKPELQEKYGYVWDAIQDTRDEMREYGPVIAAYTQNRFFGSPYFGFANSIIELAEQLKLPEDERASGFRAEKIDSTINSIFPEEFDDIIANMRLRIQLDYVKMNLGDDNEFVQKLTGGKKGEDAVKYVLSVSSLANREKVLELAKKDAETILESDDPFIYFMLNTREELAEATARAQEIRATEGVLQNLLGQAMYDVYGTSIPPDANFTLRLGDGVLKSFDYNGTKAPVKATFYGMYDRWYGFNKEYPWNLPQKWEDPSLLDLSTPFNFISTNDLVGGSSGSAVIDRNAELVGIAFDGNIQSLTGDFIYLTKVNRCVAVSSKGMMEAFNKIYKAESLVHELTTGTRLSD